MYIILVFACFSTHLLPINDDLECVVVLHGFTLLLIASIAVGNTCYVVRFQLYALHSNT